jgi:IclR family transcriptional regulator, acetate operon repressor
MVPDGRFAAPAQERPARVQSVARGVAVLMEVAASPSGLTVKEISEALGLSRPTVYHLVHTLASEGLLSKGDRRRHRLGLRVGALAEAFQRQLAPPDYLLPHVRSLAAVTSEAAYAAGWRDGEIVLFARVPGRHAVTVSEINMGLAGDAHARASGKVLLAFAPPDVRADYLAKHPLQPRTANTIVDLGEFDHELRRIRELGYAVDQEEFIQGVCCLAAPLAGGGFPYAIALSAPTDRFRANFDRYLHALSETSRDALGTGRARTRSDMPRDSAP